jgi:retinol dehydrogenase-14
MTGRTALITGDIGVSAWHRQGRARMGANVAITGRDAARAEATAREIRTSSGAQVDVLVADLSSQWELRRLAAEALDRLPWIDVWSTASEGYGTPGT